MRIPVTREFDPTDPIGYLQLRDGIEIVPGSRFALSYGVLEQDSAGNPTKIAVQQVSLINEAARPKHGGYLGYDLTVNMGVARSYPSGKREYGQGITIASTDEEVRLDPKQALSLLMWLVQHEQELTNLAREQERKNAEQE